MDFFECVGSGCGGFCAVMLAKGSGGAEGGWWKGEGSEVAETWRDAEMWLWFEGSDDYWDEEWA